MKKYILLLFAFLIFAATGCRKEAPELRNPNDKIDFIEPSDLFEAFWHGMNNNYVFWDIDPTDWDRVYDEYMPRFKELDKQEYNNLEDLEDLYYEITNDLIDHHYYIDVINTKMAPTDTEFGFRINPGYYEVSNRDYSHRRITEQEIEASINANKDAGRIENFVSGQSDAIEMQATSYQIDGITYFQFSSFSFEQAFQQPDYEDTQSIIQTWKNFHDLSISNDTKGIILDMRNNGGGNMSDFEYIIGHLIQEPLKIGYTRAKSGYGRLDYREWAPLIVLPSEIHRSSDAPIVALVDIWSASMSETTAIAISKLPNSCVIGERTYGATGPLRSYKRYYCGSFDGYSFTVGTSSSMFKGTDGTIYEGVGVTPDYESYYDAEGFANGIDSQLERAIKYIKEGN